MVAQLARVLFSVRHFDLPFSVLVMIDFMFATKKII